MIQELTAGIPILADCRVNMDRIEDEDVGRLWAIHYPKHGEEVKSKTLCLAMYMMTTDKARTIILYGCLEDRISYAWRNESQA